MYNYTLKGAVTSRRFSQHMLIANILRNFVSIIFIKNFLEWCRHALAKTL